VTDTTNATLTELEHLDLAATVAGLRPLEVLLPRHLTVDNDGLRFHLIDWGNPDKPTILFLHGLGQTGTDGERQARMGLGRAIRDRESSFPFLIVFPQAQKVRPTIVDTWFPDRPEGARALAILDEVKKQFTTDPKRVYLTGLSMGGFGTWAMAAAFPDKWAAIAPVFGGYDPNSVEKVKDVPCWCFHGDRDPAVKVDQSRRLVSALKRLGVAPEYTEYEGVGHNCWDRAYGTDKLYQWLLQHHLK